MKTPKTMKGRVIIECKTGVGASELAARLEKWTGDRGEGALYAANVRTSMREHAERITWEKTGALGDLLAEQAPKHEPNPNCDKGHCRSTSGEVRLLPLSRDPYGGNIILCRACFEEELRWRIERNRDLEESCKFALPKWEDLEVYP